MNSKVFISYTLQDREWAQWIGVTLRDNGYQPILHEWEVGAGDDVAHWMDKSLAEADRVIGVFTEAYAKAMFSRVEVLTSVWKEIEGRKGFFVPIEVQRVKNWPPLVLTLKRLSLVGQSEINAETNLLEFLKPPTALASRPQFPGQWTSGASSVEPENGGDRLPKDRPVVWPREEARTTYRECNYDLIAEWYDRWYEGIWNKDEPFQTIKRIGETSYRDVFHRTPSAIKVLDCACGTGNSYVAFKLAKYNVFGTDGSKEMLKHAKSNCEGDNIKHDQILDTPINWQDLGSYKRHLMHRLRDDVSFDVIVNTSNSFCHIPPTDDYMTLALQNFKALLRPGGLLIIDTKRYVETNVLTDEAGNPRERVEYREQRFVDGHWKIRTEREDKRFIPELGGWIRFHTRLHYDFDHSFGQPVNRALIVLTIYGGTLFPRTYVIPYYPLPAQTLKGYMDAAGFETCVFPANEAKDAEYRYDLVVGRKAR